LPASAGDTIGPVRAPRPSSRSLFTVAGLLISAVAAYFSLRKIDYGRSWHALASADYRWLIGSVLVLALVVVVRVARWQYLFRAQTRPAFAPATRAMIVGLFFNLLLPARAGEAARIVALHRETGASRSETFGTIVVERVFDVLSLLLLLFISLPFLPTVSWASRAAIVAAVAFGLAVAGAVLVRLWGLRLLEPVFRGGERLRLLPRGSAGSAAERLTHGLAGLQHARVIGAAGSLTVLSWLLVGVSYWGVLEAFGLPGGYALALLVMVTTSLAFVIPSAPAALGVFEASAIAAFRVQHVGYSSALSCALVLHALNFFPFLIAGPVALRRGRRARAT
jgi:glycosyltransferase 2 family protein